jgi:hypothetical protein
MRSLSGEPRAAAIETRRAIADDDEQLFGHVGSVLSSVSRTLWPSKTAAHLAAATNCSVRAAEMYLAGDREFSGDAIAAIVSEILKRHSMRNVKVIPKR